MNKDQNRNCWLYVLNTLADWEVGYLTAELNSGRYLSRERSIVLKTAGSSLDAVVTMGGLKISPDEMISNIDFKEGDLLILPGGDTWMEAGNQKVLSMVPGLLEKGVIVAAICGATIALAQTGVFDDKEHTSNDKGYLKMVCPEYKGEALYKEQPVAVDGNLITATGIAPLEFAREVLRKTGAMKEETLEPWYQLYRTKEAKYFFSLMESLS